MGIIGKDFKYKILDNFLNKEEISLLRDFCIIRHRLNINDFDSYIPTLDTAAHGDPIMDSLLINKRNFLEKESGLQLLPTYSFWRMYTFGAEMVKHKDRDQCEISVTVTIDSDNKKEWPIYLDGKPIVLKAGQAILYLGKEIEHWRDAFEGDWQAQTFLHYVDKNGKYANNFKDGRLFYGIMKEIK
jgi:hypothetical protein